jgi:predicted transposase YdaD
MGVKEILLDRAKNEGLERGRQEERAKVEDEKKELAFEMARNFKNLGISIGDIAKGTGLSPQEIEAL